MGSTDKEFLKAIEEKVKAIEDRRPGYDPEDLDSLTHTITWTLSLLMNYDDLDHVIYSTLEEYRQKGEPEPEDLRDKLNDVRRKKEDVLKISNTAWNDFKALTEKAQAEKSESETPEESETEQEPKQAESYAAKRISTFLFPVDKVNRTVWDLGPIEGKKQINIKVEKAHSKVKVDIPFSIDFTELQKTAPQLKELNAVDKRVWAISDALYRAGNRVVTYDQIYKYIGHSGNSYTTKKEKMGSPIDNAYSKLNAQIFFDNKQEIDAGYHYKHFKYIGPILPNERLETDDKDILVNGQKTDYAINLLSESRLLDFAIERSEKKGQVLKVPIEVYQTPLNVTNENARLEDYFLTWLARALDGGNKSLQMQTIYRQFKVTGKDANSRKRRARLNEKIVTLLDYYKSCDLVANGNQLSGFTMGDELKLKIKQVTE